MLELRCPLMRHIPPTSCSTRSTSALSRASVFRVAAGRPELAGWRGLRLPDVAKALSYELLGFTEVSRDSIWF